MGGPRWARMIHPILPMAQRGFSTSRGAFSWCTRIRAKLPTVNSRIWISSLLAWPEGEAATTSREPWELANSSSCHWEKALKFIVAWLGLPNDLENWTLGLTEMTMWEISAFNADCWGLFLGNDGSVGDSSVSPKQLNAGDSSPFFNGWWLIFLCPLVYFRWPSTLLRRSSIRVQLTSN